MRDKGFDSPEDIFDLYTFSTDPAIFYSNAGQTLPFPGKSTPTHAFIKMLDDKGKLLTNYTQNIDNIEANVGISPHKLIQCHGSWATFTCQKCGFKAPGQQFYNHVAQKCVAHCPKCIEDAEKQKVGGTKRKRTKNSAGKMGRKNSYGSDSDDDAYDIPEPGVMKVSMFQSFNNFNADAWKPNITFFGEKLSDIFFDRFRNQDRQNVDLVLVIGTSMTVAPVSEIPLALPAHVPHIYISRDVSLFT